MCSHVARCLFFDGAGWLAGWLAGSGLKLQSTYEFLCISNGVRGGFALPFPCPDDTGGAFCEWDSGIYFIFYVAACLRNMAAKAHASMYPGRERRESPIESKWPKSGFHCTWLRKNASLPDGRPGVRCVSRLPFSYALNYYYCSLARFFLGLVRPPLPSM